MSQNNRRGHRSRSRQNRNNFNREQSYNKNSSQDSFQVQGQFHRKHIADSETIEKHEEALRELKSRRVICAKCGEPIADLSSAIADKNSGAPVHFDCVLEEVKSKEKLGENEKVSYIGQGRFAVIHFDNMRDQRHFNIVKIIEWESRDAVYDWRTEMSGLYSKVE